MKLTPPKQITYWISVILGALGVIGYFVPTLPLIGSFAFWLVTIGLILLALANVMTGL